MGRGVVGLSEVGSEFCRGISCRGEGPEARPSPSAELVWSCRDWEPGMEVWVFTGTRWAIWIRGGAGVRYEDKKREKEGGIERESER